MLDSPEIPTRSEPLDPNKIFLPSNVELRFLFSKHHAAVDVGDPDEFRRSVRSSDIVIPESLAWNQAWLDDTRLVAKGKDNVYKHWKNAVSGLPDSEFALAMGSALFNSHAQVVFVDYSVSDITPEELSAQHSLVGPKEELLGSNFDDAVERFNSQIQQAAKVEKDREDHMLLQFGPRLTEAIDPNPKLAKKERVAVLAILGTGHRRVYDLLKQRYSNEDELPHVSQETVQEPIQSIYNRVKLIYKSGETTTDDARKRMLLECVGESLLMPMRSHPDFSWLDVKKSSEILSALSEGEIREMYDSLDRESKIVDLQAPVWRKIQSMRQS